MKATGVIFPIMYNISENNANTFTKIIIILISILAMK